LCAAFTAKTTIVWILLKTFGTLHFCLSPPHGMVKKYQLKQDKSS